MTFDYHNYQYSTEEMKRFLCTDGEDSPSDITCRLFFAACDKAYEVIGHGGSRVVSAVYDTLTMILDISFPIPEPDNVKSDYVAPDWAEYIQDALLLFGNTYENYSAIEKACNLRFANVRESQPQTS